MRTITLLLSAILACLQTLQAADVKFQVTGLQADGCSVVTLGSENYLSTLKINSNGEYSFTDVPEGEYFLKIEASGYNLPNAQKVIITAEGEIQPESLLKLPVTQQSGQEDEWKHSWSEDISTSGHTTTSHINTPPTIEFLGKKIVPADVPSVGILHSDYNIILSDDKEMWTQEYAYRLLETLKTIPVAVSELKPAKFTLTTGHLSGDITISNLGEGIEVTLSQDAFVYANPFLVNLDGVRGRFFSKRLHQALVNYITDSGQNELAVNRILSERFNCTTYVPDYEALTKGTTNENAGSFQNFAPDELVSILTMLEELPEGFHKTPHLNYLIRRQNGQPHPLYAEATAVAWTVNNGYIEFMESTFESDKNRLETLRLILHEKSHFLWNYSFPNEIKNDWIELGGWHKNTDASEEWSTTKETEFVSAYAHAKSPDEDMAESVACYISNPELLQARSIGKYEFMRDRIMHGTRYISQIPGYLTFEVLNLNPDYNYPGKIKRLDVTVEGEPDEDKTVTIEIELNHIEGFKDGASDGHTRLTSPVFLDENGQKKSQFYDVRFAPFEGNPYLLRGTVIIKKYSKTGYWTTNEIKLIDEQGNQRFDGRNDCVWNMYIDNPLEDTEAARYESGSLNYELTDTIIDGHKAQDLKVTYKVTDNIGLRDNQPVLARLQRGTSYYTWADKYGNYNPETQIATIHFSITEYFPTEEYFVSQIVIYDKGENVTSILFSESTSDEPVKKILIQSPDPDTTEPEIDLNRITVYAEPTNREAPDGETLVTIHYYARDDKSGLGKVAYYLRDPQGKDHAEYHYHENFNTIYFQGDPTVWKHYTINCILPQGSAPGIWGLSLFEVSDKVWNTRVYEFVETFIFEPDNSTTDYVLFSEMTEDNTQVNLQLESPTTPVGTYSYRIINEDTGEEIDGEINNHPDNLKRKAPLVTNIDVSSLSDGELIAIVQVKDENNEAIAVRSARMTKDTRVSPIINPAPQTVVYNGENQRFKIESEIKEGFKLKYQREEEITEQPVQSGIYDVIISREADKQYKSFELTIEKGLIIEKADIELFLPEIENIPMFNSPLSSLNLTGGKALRKGSDEIVKGTFVWEDAEEIMNQSGSYKIDFKPTDKDNYTDAGSTMEIRIHFPVTYRLKGLDTADNIETAEDGNEVNIQLTPLEPLILPETIHIEMAEKVLTPETDYGYNSRTGEISISKVTGNILIEAEGIDPTAIKEIQDDIDIYTEGRMLRIKAPIGSYIRLYSANGTIVFASETTTGTLQTEPLLPGCYIVKINQKTVKINIL